MTVPIRGRILRMRNEEVTSTRKRGISYNYYWPIDVTCACIIDLAMQ